MNEIVRAAPAVYAVELDDELLVWDGRAETLHRLNPFATRVWHAITAAATTTGATDIIAAEAGLDLAHARRDVEALVAELCAADVLEMADVPKDHARE